MIINAIYDDIPPGRQSFILLPRRRGICGRYTLNINALRLEVGATISSSSDFFYTFCGMAAEKEEKVCLLQRLCALRLENNRPGLFVKNRGNQTTGSHNCFQLSRISLL